MVYAELGTEGFKIIFTIRWQAMTAVKCTTAAPPRFALPPVNRIIPLISMNSSEQNKTSSPCPRSQNGWWALRGAANEQSTKTEGWETYSWEYFAVLLKTKVEGLKLVHQKGSLFDSSSLTPKAWNQRFRQDSNRSWRQHLTGKATLPLSPPNHLITPFLPPFPQQWENVELPRSTKSAARWLRPKAEAPSGRKAVRPAPSF